VDPSDERFGLFRFARCKEPWGRVDAATIRPSAGSEVVCATLSEEPTLQPEDLDYAQNHKDDTRSGESCTGRGLGARASRSSSRVGQALLIGQDCESDNLVDNPDRDFEYSDKLVVHTGPSGGHERGTPSKTFQRAVREILDGSPAQLWA
jgi:hypothetical protein